MKFIKLESRGGNYLVVASNVAWLRVAENGQTSVGIVGGQPLLVVGSPEEVAAKILGAAGNEPDAAPTAPVAAPAPAAAPVVAPVAAPKPEPVPTPEPEPEPEPVAAAPEPVVAAPAPKPALTPAPTGEQPKPAVRKGTSLSERIAAAAAPKVKAGNQRLMGARE
jgi:outer membrane biosynthesis protein TonB